MRSYVWLMEGSLSWVVLISALVAGIRILIRLRMLILLIWSKYCFLVGCHRLPLNTAHIKPGQDFNNARILDFADVQNPDNNKLNRSQNSRMGWSDIALCLDGPVVQDLRSMFVERWNFIFKEKYDEQQGDKYSALDLPYLESGQGPMDIQLIRSASQWSNGTRTEKSIQNAYIDTIRNSQHFIYIENQFFITATDNDSGPVKNRIGEAIVERVVRAYQEGIMTGKPFGFQA